jgi:hypothetical protein
MSDLHRIKGDLAKAKQRIADMESGKVGTSAPTPDPLGHITESMEQFQARSPHTGRAFENQLNARRADVARLESEYLNAMLAERQWTPAGIIERMERPT